MDRPLGTSVNSTLRSAVGLGCCLWHPELAAGSEGRGAACAGILSCVRARQRWGWRRSPVLAKLGCCSCHGNVGGLPSRSRNPTIWVAGWGCAGLGVLPGTSSHPKIVANPSAQS